MFNKNDYKFFISFSVFWVMVAWIALVLTMSGFFYRWIIIIPVIIFILLRGKIFWTNLLNISKFFLFLNAITLLFIAVYIFFSGSTVFSGRDQGSISQASIRLAQFHKLEFSSSVSKTFFEINSKEIKNKYNNCIQKTNQNYFYKFYCNAISTGKALNFPGFYYNHNGNLITQFPLGYISWLALFYIFFGIKGFWIANAILFYIFIISLVFILNKLTIATKKTNSKFSIKKPFLIIFLIIIFTAFPFFWFFKFTLSENMALAFLWLSIFQTIVIIKYPKHTTSKDFLKLLLFSSFLIFLRIEGFLFFLTILFILLLQKKYRKYFRNNLKIIIFLFIFILLLFFWNIISNVYFYKSILKVILENLSSQSVNIGKNNNTFFDIRLLKIFVIYGMAPPLFLGFLEIIILLKNKKYPQLLPFLITLPTFPYLFNPQITPDHPWMLRRFVFAVFPALLLYSFLLLYNLIIKNKYLITFFITFLLIAPNFYLFVKYITFQPEKNLLRETKILSKSFSDKDLVLVDRMASGNNWKILAEPINSLFGINAVYFFNPNDLNKINTKIYAKIYLIAPIQKYKYYMTKNIKNKLKFSKNYKFDFIDIENKSLDNASLPERKEKHIKGIVFEIIK